MSDLVIANETITALDRAAATGMIAQAEASQFKKMALIAGSISELRALLNPKVMTPIMALQNTALGFMTDKKPNGYDVDTVRDCLIEATLSGVYPVGNEFNIIAGRCYITKEGFGHKLRDINGLSYMITPGIPCGKEGGSVVKMLIEWSLRGKANSKDINIAVRVNTGMGTDAIIGKATRKARAWLFTAVTGQEVGDGDVDTDYVDVRAQRVGASGSSLENPPPTEKNVDELPM